MTKTLTTTHTGTVTAITPKTIVVFLVALDLEVDVPIHARELTQNVRIPAVGDSATVQVSLQDGDIVATAAATFVPQQDICKNIHVGKDDGLLLLDDDEEYGWDDEPYVEDFWNWDID